MSEDRRKSGGRGGRESGGTTPVEWVVAGLSALLVAGIIAFLVYDATQNPDAPPDIQVSVDSIVGQGSGWVVMFRARNVGGATAASVPVTGTLTGPDGEIQSVTATIDFIPVDGTRRGGLFFTHDPKRFRLELQAEGYDVP